MNVVFDSSVTYMDIIGSMIGVRGDIGEMSRNFRFEI